MTTVATIFETVDYSEAPGARRGGSKIRCACAAITILLATFFLGCQAGPRDRFSVSRDDFTGDESERAVIHWAQHPSVIGAQMTLSRDRKDVQKNYLLIVDAIAPEIMGVPEAASLTFRIDGEFLELKPQDTRTGVAGLRVVETSYFSISENDLQRLAQGAEVKYRFVGVATFDQDDLTADDKAAIAQFLHRRLVDGSSQPSK